MNLPNNYYYAVYKPRNMVSQFVSSHKVRLLSHLNYQFPENTHAVGRLDNNSEGLLLLTTNKRVTRLLFEDEEPHKRVYLVQVKKVVSEETLHILRTGVSIRVKGGGDYTTLPCEAEIIEDPKVFMKYETGGFEFSPSTWLKLSLTEGKYHQVRKMVAAVNHQCKRLIRWSIEDLTLGSLEPGEVKELEEIDFFNLLKIKDWAQHSTAKV